MIIKLQSADPQKFCIEVSRLGILISLDGRNRLDFASGLRKGRDKNGRIRWGVE